MGNFQRKETNAQTIVNQLRLELPRLRQEYATDSQQGHEEAVYTFIKGHLDDLRKYCQIVAGVL